MRGFLAQKGTGKGGGGNRTGPGHQKTSAGSFPFSFFAGWEEMHTKGGKTRDVGRGPTPSSPSPQRPNATRVSFRLCPPWTPMASWACGDAACARPLPWHVLGSLVAAMGVLRGCGCGYSGLPSSSSGRDTFSSTWGRLMLAAVCVRCGHGDAATRSQTQRTREPGKDVHDDSSCPSTLPYRKPKLKLLLPRVLRPSAASFHPTSHLAAARTHSLKKETMASIPADKKYTYAVKAYKNPDFLNSGHARFIRVMCEYEVRPCRASPPTHPPTQPIHLPLLNQTNTGNDVPSQGVRRQVHHPLLWLRPRQEQAPGKPN